MIVPLLIVMACGTEEPPPSGDPCETATLFIDQDADGFGSPYEQTNACPPLDGYVDNAQDCDDSNPEAIPDQQWFLDIDGDGYGDNYEDASWNQYRGSTWPGEIIVQISSNKR